MMRFLLVLIILGVGGYFGWNYYQEHPEKFSKLPFASGSESESEPSAPPPIPKAPEFQSKIPLPESGPGEKHLAKPGVYYMLERASVETPTGIKAINPGEEVRLLERRNGKMRVTIGTVDFEVLEKQVTNDLDLARDAEKRQFLSRTGVRP
jgi:hypothetical protein